MLWKLERDHLGYDIESLVDFNYLFIHSLFAAVTTSCHNPQDHNLYQLDVLLFPTKSGGSTQEFKGC
jgi:hypothetical protein